MSEKYTLAWSIGLSINDFNHDKIENKMMSCKFDSSWEQLVLIDPMINLINCTWKQGHSYAPPFPAPPPLPHTHTHTRDL